MADNTTDRRVQRTRGLLRRALVQLVKEKGFDTVTIRDITERANLGRTTFYLHYTSKEDLLLDHHAADITGGYSLSIFNREELLGDTPQPDMVKFLELLTQNRSMYRAIRAAKDSDLLLRGVFEQICANLQSSLKAIFPNAEPVLPLQVLTTYIIGAQLSLIHWWMTTHTAYTPLQLATMLHRLQRAAVCDAYQMV